MSEQRLRALIVGAGGLGRVWLQTVQAFDQTEVAGVVDVRPQAAESATADAGLDNVHAGVNLDDALEAVRPDFVVDVTVPSAHHEVVIRSLEWGAPVLGEKPMADTMDKARAMVAAADRSGKLYMVSQSRRYDPNLFAFRDLIQSQAGLPLGILNADFYIGVHMDSFRHNLEHLLLLDMGVHILDKARYLSGEEPVAVYCEDFNPAWSWLRGMSSASAIFEMTNGLRFTFRGSWVSEGRHTSWQSEWRAVGPNGTAMWDGLREPVAEIVVGPGEWISQLETRTPAAIPEVQREFAGSLRDFVRALRTGETPMGECHDNIKSLAMALCAIQSAETRTRVPIEV
ncbi:MAG TPA: Gfo/Idh/MocA family oxidoreductase [Chloroflexota bacterium]